MEFLRAFNISFRILSLSDYPKYSSASEFEVTSLTARETAKIFPMENMGDSVTNLTSAEVDVAAALEGGIRGRG
jgi:hypothetical protein